MIARRSDAPKCTWGVWSRADRMLRSHCAPIGRTKMHMGAFDRAPIGFHARRSYALQSVPWIHGRADARRSARALADARRSARALDP